MVKQSLIQWSSDLQYNSFVLIWLDGRSGRPNLINRQVTSSPITYMCSLDRILQFALAANSQPFLSYRFLKAIAEGQLLRQNMTLTTLYGNKYCLGKNGALNSTSSLSILVLYPRLNQGEWVSSLVNSQHSFDSVVDGGVQNLWRTNITSGFFK